MNTDFFKNKKIDAVIFDLDNTLSDRKYAFRCHAGRMWDMFGKDKSADMKDTFVKRLCELDKNGYSDKNKMYVQICGEFDVSCAPDEMSAEWDVSAEMFPRREPYAGEILRYLHGKYALGLLSNGLSLTQRIKLKGTGLSDMFSEIMISEEVGIEKPDPQIFRLMCSKLGCAADNSVYVGDHFKNDIEGALSAGMYAVLYDRYGVYEEKYPLTVHSLADIEEFL